MMNFIVELVEKEWPKAEERDLLQKVVFTFYLLQYIFSPIS